MFQKKDSRFAKKRLSFCKMRVFFSGFLRVFLFPALLFHPLFGRETGGGAEGLEEVWPDSLLEGDNCFDS